MIGVRRVQTRPPGLTKVRQQRREAGPDAQLVSAAKETRALVFLGLSSAAFSAISVLSIRDAEFLAGTGTVTLPLLEVKVPIGVFFVADPLFLLLLFLYMFWDLRRLSEGAPPAEGFTVWPLRELQATKGVEGMLLSLASIVFVWFSWPAVATLLTWAILPFGQESGRSPWLCWFNVATTGVAWSVAFWNFVVLRAASPGLVRRATRVLCATPAILAVLGGLVIPYEKARPIVVERVFTDFRASELGPIDLRRRRLINADFSRAVLPQAKLQSADLRGASFFAAIVTYADFDRAQMAGANFSEARARNAKFPCGREEACRGLVLAAADLRGVVFANSWISQAPDADLSGASLWRAHLSDANLASATISGTNFSESEGTNLRLEGARGLRPNFFEAVLDGAHFEASTLDTPNFTAARLSGACFNDATLAGARLSGAQLQNAHFEGADLSGADITGSTNLAGATYDRFTRFSPTFDPASRGMIQRAE